MQHYYRSLHNAAVQGGISPREWEWFVQRTTIRHIPSGFTIIQADEEVNDAYYCVQGLFRLYYALRDGKDFNVAFTLEDDYATSYGAMVTGSKSLFNIEALEDSVVIEIPYDTLKLLMDRSHMWERFIRKAVERLYIRKEEREKELLCLSALERYHAFLAKYPGLEHRIPQYHIASYIGVSPVSLSRLLHG
ncbi:Crp/Fnr family transcriptional regulator [Paenibacillus hubeiensis]|uniref:Crp/Fnr family transcriptional regulator n=1 Tax=Paenibacillus hubeiensis TaxID=3077330 RepID=UPI0031BA0B97